MSILPTQPRTRFRPGSNLDLSKGDLPADVLGRLLKDIADLGLFILISELDVKE